MQEGLSRLYTPEQLAFCRALPKIELHAHLNGSIPADTLRRGTFEVNAHSEPLTDSGLGVSRELAAAKGITGQSYQLISKGVR